MASSSSSTSVILEPKYDVFLSFRGEDTRDGFTSHLYAALCRKQIRTFIDDGIPRGDHISPALLEAVEESKISVIIFSKDYASSKWCLDELVSILECKKKKGQTVIPVFYHINPSDIRKQTGSFKEAFDKHDKDFKQEPEKVQRWRDALTEASNLSGWDSTTVRPESKLVDKIVDDILRKWNDISSSSNCESFVGIDSRVEHIKSLLCIGLSEFRVVGIWGMGGAGKTTIAEVVFSQIRDQFEGCCFIRNVREESAKCRLIHLKEQLLSKLLEENNLNIGTLNTVPIPIKHRVQRKKVFIVLDDVDDPEQLDFLTGGLAGFGPESRVMVTTRDKQVLCTYGVDNIYQVKELNHQESSKLFCNHAFKQKYPPMDFLELVNKVVHYTKGNPLAIKVLGSYLYLKTKMDWISALNKLKCISNPKIYNMLKISYDGLDREIQDIFLDIACFFKREEYHHVTKILDSCYLSTHVGLRTLIDKSLITILDGMKLEMHDLLQEMGWEIVRHESFKEPGKRSRLWNHEDIFHVLKNNTGTDAVEGLFLDVSKIPNLHLNCRAFENMPNLKLLKFYIPNCDGEDFFNINKVHLSQGLTYLSNELRYLHWHGYPLRSLPSSFSPKNLVELNLPYSNVDEQLWEGTEHGPGLKLICNPSPIQYLDNLRTLNLRGCESVNSFPSNIQFRSLITLKLSNCINLKEFPLISRNIRYLHLNGTAIDEVPSSVAHLTELSQLNLRHCRRLKSISPNIYELKSLHWLYVSNCRISISQLSFSTQCWTEIRRLRLGFCNVAEVPLELCYLSSLRYLDLCGNNFEILPSTLKQLSQLKYLLLRNCNMLRSIPELPLALKHLDASNCCLLQSLPDIPANIEELDESELEIVSKCCDKYYLFKYMQFKFTNCLNLNHYTLTDSFQRIQHMATLALKLCFEKVFDKIPGVLLCLPGSEIPGWFSHKSSGPSITIQLPQPWLNTKFIGFALSAVLAFEKNYGEISRHCKVSCCYRLKDNCPNRVRFGCRFLLEMDHKQLNMPDHIVIGYSPCKDAMLLKSGYTSIQFKFHGGNDSKVKYCGVHPLFAKSKMTTATRGSGTVEP